MTAGDASNDRGGRCVSGEMWAVACRPRHTASHRTRGGVWQTPPPGPLPEAERGPGGGVVRPPPSEHGTRAMMIECNRVTKYFGPVLALDEVTFEVDRGQVVGFLGLNGAGKTTTMRILTTYLPATSGVARVAGFDVMSQSMEVRQNIGYLPDNVPLYAEMRVEEYLDYRAKLKGVDRKKRRARLEECFDRCRIREVRRRLCGTLSKGYRQRVGLADALIHDPAILILDEPTAGLHPEQQDQTLSLIRELGRDRTILFSTHRLTEIEENCQQVIIIFRGRIRLHRKLKDLEPA